MKDLYVGDFKPEDDDADAGKKSAMESNEGDMMTKLMLVIAFFAVLGFLYTMIE